ncbi:MAG: PKD domain-containing protein, partial [Bacteroidota bacterium]
MKKIIPILLTFGLLFSAFTSHAYEFTITGTVSFADGQPAPFGVVRAEADFGEVQETQLGFDGTYSIVFEVPDGTVANIVVSTLDFCDGSEIGFDVLTEGEAAVVDFEVCSEITPPACQAAFDFLASDNDPLTINFFNQSLGEADTYLWDFGDGNTSTEENPVHTYTEEGTYLATLTISGTDCSSTGIQTVIAGQLEPCNCGFVLDPVCILGVNGEIIPFLNPCLAECEGFTIDDFVDCEITPPIDCFADFTFDRTEPGGLTIQFSDLSIGEIDSWLWNFGDGNTSTEQNPLHTYTDPGLYEVTLVVNGDSCSSVYIGAVQAGGLEPCNCDFEFDPVCVEDENGDILSFPNFCTAECEGFDESDLVACDNGGGCNCGFEFDPVCVLDTISGEILPFLNPCLAECEGFTPNDFVECDNIGGCNCDPVYDPVCVLGPNGEIRSFSNACFAECEGFTAADFVACDNGCNCDFEFNPVCVLDSLTGDIISFPNACLAECEGFTPND